MIVYPSIYSENFFKDAGEVVDVRFATSKDDGSFRGFGHVEFATAEAAQKVGLQAVFLLMAKDVQLLILTKNHLYSQALQLHGKPLLGRDIRLDVAAERGDRPAYTPQSG